MPNKSPNLKLLKSNYNNESFEYFPSFSINLFKKGRFWLHKLDKRAIVANKHNKNLEKNLNNPFIHC